MKDFLQQKSNHLTESGSAGESAEIQLKLGAK
jgi:hypothetical protein